MKAYRVHEFGGPEALSWDDVELPPPGPGQARVRHTAIGLNFIDVYHRTGLYPNPRPFTPGSEAAGVIEAVGAGVGELAVGDRVAYGGVIGAYAQARNIAADRLVALPASIDDRTAAAMMLKGMTAEYLVVRIAKVTAGTRILIHAAAGGVGSIACQWARALGATVIGTVSSDDKAAQATANGCHHTIVYTREDFIARTRELTLGQGVDAVLDGVGKDTFLGSLDCLRPRGILASFGQSSGSVPPFAPTLLSQKGSLFLTRPTLAHYTQTRAELNASAAALFDVVSAGHVKIEIGQSFPLAEAAAGHRALESRATTGSTVFYPV